MGFMRSGREKQSQSLSWLHVGCTVLCLNETDQPLNVSDLLPRVCSDRNLVRYRTLGLGGLNFLTAFTFSRKSRRSTTW